MGKLSKEKGKRGERMFAALLKRFGWEARRGQQFAGGTDSPDVVHSIEGIHFEVKYTERLKMWDALEQAEEDRMGFEMGVVAHKANRKDWVAILYMDDFLFLLRELEQRDIAAVCRRAELAKYGDVNAQPDDA